MRYIYWPSGMTLDEEQENIPKNGSSSLVQYDNKYFLLCDYEPAEHYFRF